MPVASVTGSAAAVSDCGMGESRYFQSHRRERPKPVTETCPICGERAVLVQDHCHTTSLCRDRICGGCNVLLGRIESQPTRLEQLLAYIAGWKAQHASGGTRYRAAKV